MFNEDPVAPFTIDEASFSALYNRYWYESLNLARQLMQDDFVAEDIVQNIFISLWKRRDTLKIDQPVAHYLKRAVKFAVAAYIRDKTRQDNIHLTAMPASLNAHADAPLLHRELQDKLSNFIEQLPDQNQRVYHMRFHHALDNPQIASILGISEKTVRNQLSMVMKRIRTYLVKEGY
ncbi:sigma-70 family RNA polymerase sigma factor [Chitinophaga arvensicola]|uniref:RNA polymerase sigma-70 factor, ECF subfamily n=1 Tax=Chitinophaga arvensicola TaxID=29529 RepID=A0A1I0RH13_9BACT|nr:sigma-70 family RNA polymerase sigma factor [Chitinophaga arvensicola]SEW40122.1 RNA polymerase sigma-70 factor, ECF subfamily [Chitinophaga arvensicola]